MASRASVAEDRQSAPSPVRPSAVRPMAMGDSAPRPCAHACGPTLATPGQRGRPRRPGPLARSVADRDRGRADARGDRRRVRAADLAALARPAGARQPGLRARDGAGARPHRGHQARPSGQPVQEPGRGNLRRRGRLVGGVDHARRCAGAGRPARDEPPIAYDPPVGAPIRVDGNGPVDDYVSFTPLGEPRRLSGALQMGTFSLCRAGHDEVQVVLAATGRVRTVRTRTRCP